MKTPAHHTISRECAIQVTTGDAPIHELDKPRTFKQAAAHPGVGYHLVRGAARRGLVRSFRLGTSREYVTLRSFLELMERDANR
jgi:hypothetical protein